MKRWLARAGAGALALWGVAAAAQAPDAATLAALRARPAADEIIYFLLPDRFDNGDAMNDRGGLAGGRLATGFDPAAANFYNGGDLAGIARRLDYIKGLGATAIWLAPVFANKPVQGAPGQESAGFHGYWITDFTRVDPHFGSNADFAALVDAAHARGLKVYMDIVVNHTADIIRYRECDGRPCPYRPIADYPFTRQGGVSGQAINQGFAGDGDASPANWARLTRPDFAYTPYIPPAEARARTPAWLNDIALYHNRGESTFRGESSLYGDFVGLDDLATEHPRVIEGMIAIFKDWITRFGIDGYRIDTAQHVNPAFWQAFVPEIIAHARARGLPNFTLFGEISTDDMDVGRLARHTHIDGLPNVLDFALWAGATQAIGGNAPTSTLARLFADDVLYAGGTATARSNPSFVSNHDKGRFAWRAQVANPAASRDELARRTLLAHALMMFGRGVPTIYAGDEQGFVGTGDDNASRQPLFASRVPAYLATPRLGTSDGHDVDAFRPQHPFYRALAAMAAVRRRDARLRHGETRVRLAGDAPGLFAFSRHIPGQPGETLVVINTAATPATGHVMVEAASTRWRPMLGACPTATAAPGTLVLSLPALGYMVCEGVPE